MWEYIKNLFRKPVKDIEKEHLFHDIDDPMGLDIGWIRRDVERELKIATMDPDLTDLVEIAILPHMSQVVKEAYENLCRHGMAEPSSAPETEAIQMAEYLCWKSPKLTALAVLMADHFAGRDLVGAPPPDLTAGKVVVFAKSVATRR